MLERKYKREGLGWTSESRQRQLTSLNQEIHSKLISTSSVQHATIQAEVCRRSVFIAKGDILGIRSQEWLAHILRRQLPVASLHHPLAGYRARAIMARATVAGQRNQN